VTRPALQQLRAALTISSLATLYLVTANFTSQQSYDTIATALPAWQLAQHHNLDLTAFQGWADWIIPVQDHWVSNRFPGTILFAAPFYLLPGAGQSAPALWPAALAAVVSVTAAILLLYKAVRETAPTLAFAMTMAFAVGTPAWSVAADALWTHGPALLALACVLLGLSRDKPVPVFFGLAFAILCRPHLAVAGLVIAIYVLVTRRGWAWRLLPAAGIALGAIALLAYNAVVYGRITALGGYAADNAPIGGVGLRELPLNVLGALISPSRGVFLYTPVLLVVVPIALSSWRFAPPWVRAATLGGVSYLAVQLYLIRFSGGNRFYSYRVPLESLMLCWPLFTIAASRLVCASKRWVLVLTVVISTVITGIGATTNFISTVGISAWQQVDLVEAARNLDLYDVGLVLVMAFVAAGIMMQLPSRSATREEAGASELACASQPHPSAPDYVRTMARRQAGAIDQTDDPYRPERQ
jgi:hypothetical protein